MKLLYLSNERIPSSYANSIQQMKMCEAFVNIGLNVELVRPFYFGLANKSEDEIRDFYGIKINFKITTLPSLLSLSKPPVGQASKYKFLIPFIGGASVMISTWLFAWKQLICGKFDEPTIIYSRNVNSAYTFLKWSQHWLKSKPHLLIAEVHALEQRPIRQFEYLLRNADGLITITKSLKKGLYNKYGIPVERIQIEPDGVNLEDIESQRTSKQNARKRLGISSQIDKLVCYTGSILPGKGVDVLVEAASNFDERVQFMVIGDFSTEAEILKKRVRERHLNNINFVGFKLPRLVPLYQMAADVLILPNTGNGSFSDYTSPLKLFEYLAVGRPIVASRLPVLQEVLSDQKNAVLVDADVPHALAEGIRQVLEDNALAQRVSERARIDVQQYSWQRRAERIYNFFLNTLKDTKQLPRV